MKIRNRFFVFGHLSRANWRAWMPSRGNVLFTLVVVFAMAWAQSAHALPWTSPSASVASTITWPYQGRMADASGNPLTGSYSMTFRLYNTAFGGTTLWEETWTSSNSVQVSNGLFNVMLGSINAIPQSLVRGNNSLWLGIAVGADLEMAPRVQLGSVPYAFRATQADRALGLSAPDGNPADALFVDNAGNIGVGTTSPQATFQVNGTVKILGNWDGSKALNAMYQAPSDGIVVATAICDSGSITINGIINTDPIGLVAQSASAGTGLPVSITMPVRKGDYWQAYTSFCGSVSVDSFVRWIPFGN